MTKPLEHVLGLIPKGVLAGLFVCHLSSPKPMLICGNSGTWERTRSYPLA